MITKYDLNDQYLNCRRNQSLSYLHTKGIPIDLLFYGAYEQPKEIFQSIYEQGMNRNLYLDKVANADELELLDIKTHRIHALQFNAIEDELSEIFKRNDVALLFGDGYRLPYKQNTYMTRHELHSIVLCGINPGTGHYYVRDDIYDADVYRSGRDYITYECDAATISSFYDNEFDFGSHETLESKWDVIYYESHFNSDKPYLQSIFYPRFEQMLSHLSMDFELYTEIPDLIANASIDQPLQQDDRLLQFITILIGSRKHFMQFLQRIDAISTETIALFDRITGYLESIRYSLIKKNMTGKLDLSKLKNKCDLLKNDEESAFDTLQRSVAVNR
ncbi:hypothetical protein PaecuDRAFT_1217 [Paenibacillus curdlanolyticus YK9]|uniref:Butirosin biosynthesis protein H N-terminal domain-containing protein n=1 Tax=Paenibacillus curdlanolyticus YK9 TaxID=717606 RepID=E0I6E5_9BACL|nr:hypothetical protein [Paenibacillus curdlanolyticus]EFM11611.1 hypothetical protein PaecuDRAFT_1217 [Paenibacillus curdlanolyticus YK9]